MPHTPPLLSLSSCKVDLHRRKVLDPSGEVPLTRREAEALSYLLARAERLVTRIDLERDVWDYAEGVDSKAVPVCMRRLRAKIEQDPSEPVHLQTVRGVGWVFRLGSPTTTGGNLPAEPRSIEASLQQSWDLLGSPEQAAMTMLSVFEGPIEPAAALWVLTEAGGRASVADSLASLVDSSWLQVDAGTGRYTVLAMVQDFAAELASDTSAAQRRHGMWFANHPNADVTDQATACRRAIARGDAGVAAATACHAWAVLERIGPLCEGHTLLLDTLAVTGLTRADRQRVLVHLGTACIRLGQLAEATQWLELAQDGVDGRTDPDTLATLLQAQAALCSYQRRPGAIPLYLQALELRRQTHDLANQALVISSMSASLHASGKRDEALAFARQAVAVSGRIPDPAVEGVVLSNLAMLHQERDEPDLALERYDKALLLLRRGRHRGSEALTSRNLATLHRSQGRPHEALTCLERAGQILRHVGNRRMLAMVHGTTGSVLVDLGRHEEALAAFQQSLAGHRTANHRFGEGMMLCNLAELYVTMERLDKALVSVERAQQVARDAGIPVLQGQALLTRAMVDLQRGEQGGPSLVRRQRRQRRAARLETSSCTKATRLR